MYAYALVGYLDSESETLFKEIWKDLSLRGITNYGVDTKGKRPHITLADYNNLDKNNFIERLNKFYEGRFKVDISLSILGTFLSTGTLFLAPAMSKELIAFHGDHHEHFKDFNDNEGSLYIPGTWTPHCTIASRLSEENIVKTFKYCRDNLSKLKSKLNEIALLEIELNDSGIAVEDRIIFSKALK